MEGQPEKRHNVRAQQQEVVSEQLVDSILLREHVSLRLH